MAGARVEKFRTIYQRFHGLLKSGAVSEVSKPIWYDVYEAFPPLTEPRLDRAFIKQPDSEKGDIFYPEDLIRAQFMKKYQNYETQDGKFLSQIFVNEYLSIRKQQEFSNTSGQAIFDAVIDKLKAIEGLELTPVEQGPKERAMKWKKS